MRSLQGEFLTWEWGWTAAHPRSTSPTTLLGLSVGEEEGRGRSNMHRAAGCFCMVRAECGGGGQGGMEFPHLVGPP